MPKPFAQNSWVWFKDDERWSYGQVLTHNPTRNTYAIKVEGDPMRTRTISAATDQVQPFGYGKFGHHQRVTFVHKDHGVQWGKIIRPTSPSCEKYFVALQGDPMRGIAINASDLR